MSNIVPSSRPLQGRDTTAEILLAHGVREAVCLLVVRGYFLKTMGNPTTNDFGIYDDAIIINSPVCHLCFNANADPSRRGMNPKLGKPYAQLKPGVWKYRLGLHKGQYMALIQAEEVTVIRADGTRPAWEETGWFGINIHRGGEERTSSEGCLTLPPEQWPSFIATIEEQLQRFGQDRVPVLVINDSRMGSQG